MAAHAPSLNLISKIGDLRRDRQVSQKTLAKAVGVSENTIASWERSIPNSFVIAFKICDYFEEEIDGCCDDEIDGLKNIETLRNKCVDGPISQRELAREIDVTENTISTWETGKHTTVQKLEKLCRCLNCSVSDIYGQKPNNEWDQEEVGMPAKLRRRAPRNSEKMKVLIVRVPIGRSDDVDEIE